jgi:ribosomal subunit interface protein
VIAHSGRRLSEKLAQAELDQGDADAIMSTGFARIACAGSSARNASQVALLFAQSLRIIAPGRTGCANPIPVATTGRSLPVRRDRRRPGSGRVDKIDPLARTARFALRAGLRDATPHDMQAPVEITFRGMAPSPALEDAVATWIARLDHVDDRIQRCHVWIDLPHRHHRRGASFQVKISVAVPHADAVVSQDEHDDVYLALANAFAAARRQLQDHAQIRRGDIKHHAA